jgi:hypothetical protein
MEWFVHRFLSEYAESSCAGTGSVVEQLTHAGTHRVRCEYFESDEGKVRRSFYTDEDCAAADCSRDGVGYTTSAVHRFVAGKVAYFNVSKTAAVKGGVDPQHCHEDNCQVHDADVFPLKAAHAFKTTTRTEVQCSLQELQKEVEPRYKDCETVRGTVAAAQESCEKHLATW